MNFPKQMTVQSHTIPIVPRYAETDKAGVIHHSVYPVWFEIVNYLIFPLGIYGAVKLGRGPKRELP